MAFLPLHAPRLRARPSARARVCARMSAERVQAAKRALLDATQGVNLGRAIHDDAEKVAHMEQLMSELEREWKQHSAEDETAPTLGGRRELLYTTLPDVLAVDKARWLQCDAVVHTIDEDERGGSIEQRFVLGPLRWGVRFRFELSVLQRLKRKIQFVEAAVGNVLRFDMRKQRAVGSLVVRFCDEDTLVLRGNKGSVSVLRALDAEKM